MLKRQTWWLLFAIFVCNALCWGPLSTRSARAQDLSELLDEEPVTRLLVSRVPVGDTLVLDDGTPCNVSFYGAEDELLIRAMFRLMRQFEANGARENTMDRFGVKLETTTKLLSITNLTQTEAWNNNWTAHLLITSRLRNLAIHNFSIEMKDVSSSTRDTAWSSFVSRTMKVTLEWHAGLRALEITVRDAAQEWRTGPQRVTGILELRGQNVTRSSSEGYSLSSNFGSSSFGASASTSRFDGKIRVRGNIKGPEFEAVFGTVRVFHESYSDGSSELVLSVFNSLTAQCDVKYEEWIVEDRLACSASHKLGYKFTSKDKDSSTTFEASGTTNCTASRKVRPATIEARMTPEEIGAEGEEEVGTMFANVRFVAGHDGVDSATSYYQPIQGNHIHWVMKCASEAGGFQVLSPGTGSHHHKRRYQTTISR